MTERQHHHEPIVPKRDGQPPTWVVMCVDCMFSHDAHGADAEEAIASISGTHQKGHRLVARQYDYGSHPLYQ